MYDMSRLSKAASFLSKAAAERVKKVCRLLRGPLVLNTGEESQDVAML